MRVSAWVGACALLLTGWLGSALPARCEVQQITQAQAVIEADGQAARQARVTLPYHWDRHHKGNSGAADFEAAFALTTLPDEPFALYVPRLGNAYEIWFNGSLLQRNGDMVMGDSADFAKAPRFVPIAQGTLRTHNLVRIRIRADIGRRGGLSELHLGPEAELYPVYLRDYRLRSTGTLVVVILSVLVCLLAIALWATQVDPTVPGRPHRDPLYLLAGVAELFWTLSTVNALLENPPLPWPWWGVVTVTSTAIWVATMTLFCVEVANWSELPAARWLRRWLGLEVAGTALAAYAALELGHANALTASYAVSGLTSLVFAAIFIGKSVRQASLAHRLVAIALVINTLVGLRDLYAFRLSDTYEGNTFLRYSAVLFGLTLGYIVIARFRTASARARDLMANLTDRVARKEGELALTYHRVEQLAREQERDAERARILRDMHDGVGSHISAAIRQLQSGKATNAQVLATLRDSLDQLKLTIDAMNLPRGDVTALLANLRYRLEPRFAASDIELQWDVDLLEPIPRLDAAAMRQLQFMVFEALSNVLQHAQAGVLRIEAHARPHGGALVRIADDGRGFDTAAPLRKGLLSMHERATSIGALLAIESGPQGTAVDILLD